jgi:hypothetical protein
VLSPSLRRTCAVLARSASDEAIQLTVEWIASPVIGRAFA